ncbi:MAG TPA: glycoside hydrolase family 16 protein, partial [Polyangia bacterium]
MKHPLHHGLLFLWIALWSCNPATERSDSTAGSTGGKTHDAESGTDGTTHSDASGMGGSAHDAAGGSMRDAAIGSGGALDAAGGSGGATQGGAGGKGGSAPTDAARVDGGRPLIGDKDDKGRSLVWADEFDGPGIDRTIWGNETGFVRNNELQDYTTDATNQFIDKGDLVIKGIYVGGSGQGSYTSASLTTQGHKTFQYGRIEARIEIPEAKGSWPAFWLLPPNKSWPAGGEIDVMEWVSQERNTIYGTAHFAVGGAHSSKGGSTTPTPAPTADYHVYA